MCEYNGTEPNTYWNKVYETNYLTHGLLQTQNFSKRLSGQSVKMCHSSAFYSDTELRKRQTNPSRITIWSPTLRHTKVAFSEAKQSCSAHRTNFVHCRGRTQNGPLSGAEPILSVDVNTKAGTVTQSLTPYSVECCCCCLEPWPAHS